MQPLTILYQDEHYVAIDKPSGMLVHRTRIAEEAEYAMQRLRDQLGQHVFVVHRLDRPTSGVLLFALSSEAAREMCAVFESRQVEKRYLAVVRGWTDEAGVIDYALREEKHKEAQQALTRYRRLATVELDIPIGRYPQARYSLVEALPETGRMHQIRKHFAHIFHPLLGDTTYGEGRHNRLFRDHYGCERLLLMATLLRFIHPYSREPVTIHAAPPEDVRTLFAQLGWTEALAVTLRQDMHGGDTVQASCNLDPLP
jgi:tRNA pseudouridine65 synthase